MQREEEDRRANIIISSEQVSDKRVLSSLQRSRLRVRISASSAKNTEKRQRAKRSPFCFGPAEFYRVSLHFKLITIN
jgi:hypothetical protein